MLEVSTFSVKGKQEIMQTQFQVVGHLALASHWNGVIYTKCKDTV